MGIRDGFAEHIGKPPSEVIIPPDGIVPSIGTFVLTYDFSSRSRRLRALQAFDGALAVEFQLAVNPNDTDVMAAALEATKADASSLSSLTESINTQLEAHWAQSKKYKY